MNVKRLRTSHLGYLLLAGLSLSASGCLGVAAGAAAVAAAGGGYAYWQGEVCEQFPATFDDTYAATRTALTELGMPILEESREQGTFKSRTRDNDTVRIKLLSETSKIPADGPLTRVCVRVAAFGEHSVSTRIIEQIATHMTPHTGPPPIAGPSSGWTGPPAPTRPATTAAPPLAEPVPVTPPLPVPAPSDKPYPSSRP